MTLNPQNSTVPSSRIRKKAFSLIEVVLAVGVISFALVGIIGLFPVAMRAALESQQQTQASLIARSIFDELRNSGRSSAYVSRTGLNPDGSAERMNEGTIERIDLTANSSKTFYFNSEGKMVPSAADAVYGATVRATRTAPDESLCRVDVSIQAPVGASGTGRRTYWFTSFLHFSTT